MATRKTSNSSNKKIVVDFIRHGEPEGGDILRGRINPVLTTRGWGQMRKAICLDESGQPGTDTPRWTHIISSPLDRCREFAESVAAAARLEADIREPWQEIDYGDWDGMPIEQWRQVAAKQFSAFREDLSALAPPNGEDYLCFRDRILAAWQELAEFPDGSHLLVVTHGGVLRVILPTVLGMPLNRSFPLHIPFACFSRVTLQVQEQQVAASLMFHNAADFPAAG